MCFFMDRLREQTEVEVAIEDSFPAIAEAHPEGVRFASPSACETATLEAQLEMENEEESDLFRGVASGPINRLEVLRNA